MSRKLGRIVRSNSNTLNAMMLEHQETVEDFLLSRSGLPALEHNSVKEKATTGLEDDGDVIMVAANSHAAPEA